MRSLLLLKSRDASHAGSLWWRNRNERAEVIDSRDCQLPGTLGYYWTWLVLVRALSTEKNYDISNLNLVLVNVAEI